MDAKGTDVPSDTQNHLEDTAGGMKRTGHPSGSPVSLNETGRAVRVQVIFCEKRGDEK